MIRIREFKETNGTKENKLTPFFEDPLILKLKKLLDHLKYAFLERTQNYW